MKRKKLQLNLLNICVVTHSFAFGPPQALVRFLKDKANHLIFIGHPFLYCKDIRSYSYRYSKSKIISEKKAYPWRLPELLHYIKDILYTVWWTLLYDATKYHLYIGASNLDVLTGIILRLFGRAQVVIYYTIDFAPHRFRSSWLNRMYVYLDGFCVKKSNLVWNLSPRMVEGRESYGLSSIYRVKQITVPFGTEKAGNLPIKTDVHRYIIAYLGHLREGQGIEGLIKVMPEIMKEVPKARLKIIGTGPLENKLKQLARNLGIEQVIEFTGYVESHDEVINILSSCAIGVAPYEYTNTSFTQYADPGKPKVYISSGLPVVITRVPAFAQEVDKRGLGVAIGDNKNELTHAILKLLNDDELYLTLRNNVERFRHDNTWDKLFVRALSYVFDRQDINLLEHQIGQRKYYDKEYEAYKKYNLENWRQSFINRIFKELDLQKGDVYLDIGVGGSGYTIIEAARMGIKSVGIDLSFVAMSKAKHFAHMQGIDKNIFFVVCQGDALPFKDRIFNKVSSISVLEHIENDTTAIAEIGRVLNPGGIVYITVPNSYKKIYWFLHPIYKWHDERVGHIRHYLASELERRFVMHSLILINPIYTGHIIKLFQLLISKIFPYRKLWWFLERIDCRQRTNERGLQLSMVFRKGSPLRLDLPKGQICRG